MSSKRLVLQLTKDLGPILVRNFLSLITLFIGALAIVLIYLKDARDGIFIASVVLINAALGTIQEFRAKLALEKLQALNVQHYNRLLSNDQRSQPVLAEQLRVSNRYTLRLGDQVPVDSKVVSAEGFEINEALLTGESANITKPADSHVTSGSFVVAGSATVEVLATVHDSYITQMTSRIKTYRLNLSPVQQALIVFVRIATYSLIILAVLLTVRAFFINQAAAITVKQIAVLTASIVPEGLILATTLLFAYGAIRFYRERVLIQQINAIENLSRVKNLCIDKTGTLTTTTLTVEQIIPLAGGHSQRQIIEALSANQKASGAVNDTTQALQQYLQTDFSGQISNQIAFSSDRKYSAVLVQKNGHVRGYVIGAPDILLRFIKPPAAAAIKVQTDQLSRQAKRLLLVTQVKDQSIFTTQSLTGQNLIPLGLVVLHNPLRDGIKQVVRSVLDRGITIRLISGDNAQTVAAIAKQAGIKQRGLIVTGSDLAKWDEAAYHRNAVYHTIFARVTPEQKAKLIEAYQRVGFTAMIGDGANDALAIKKADLGIAMFGGSQISRQIAEIVLLNNSFAAIPKGLKLADSIIATLELIAALFFSKVMASFSFFALTSLVNTPYPLSPRSITFVNYFIIGAPVLFLSLWPLKKHITQLKTQTAKTILARLVPLAFINGAIVALGLSLVYFLNAYFFADQTQATIAVVISFVILGISTILTLVRGFGYQLPHTYLKNIIGYGLAAVMVVIGFSWAPPVARFFDLTRPHPISFGFIVGSVILAWIGQYYLATYASSHLRR